MKLRPFLITLLVGAITYSGYWYYVAQSAEEKIAGSFAQLEEHGISIGYDALSISGFPFRLTFTLQNARALATSGDYTVEWQGDNLQAVVQPWNFKHVIILSTDGTLNINTNDDDSFVIQSSLMQASFHQTKNQDRLSVEFTEAVVNTAEKSDHIFHSDALAFHLRLPQHGAQEIQSIADSLIAPKIADIALGASGIYLDEDAKAADTAAISEVLIAVSIHGSQLPAMNKSSLAEWRDSGGTLEIDRGRIVLPALSLEATGSFSIDNQFRPLGALSSTVASPEIAGNILQSFGLINEDANDTLSATLSFIAAFGDGDGIPVSFTAQDGKLRIGPLDLMDLDPIVTY